MEPKKLHLLNKKSRLVSTCFDSENWPSFCFNRWSRYMSTHYRFLNDNTFWKSSLLSNTKSHIDEFVSYRDFPKDRKDIFKNQPVHHHFSWILILLVFFYDMALKISRTMNGESNHEMLQQSLSYRNDEKLDLFNKALYRIICNKHLNFQQTESSNLRTWRYKSSWRNESIFESLSLSLTFDSDAWIIRNEFSIEIWFFFSVIEAVEFRVREQIKFFVTCIPQLHDLPHQMIQPLTQVQFHWLVLVTAFRL